MRMSVSRVAQLLVGLTFAATASPARADEAFAKIDAAYRDRDANPSAAAAAVTDALAASPDDYDVLWRAARWHCWTAGGLSGDASRGEAQQCWDLAKRAISLRPNAVEGNYFAASGSGQTAKQMGILKAISMGMEGVFNGYIDKAIQVDGRFENGGPYLIKGRYWYELPFIKRSYSKSESMLRKALEVQPLNVRAQIYLAETLADDGDAKAAKAILDQLQTQKPGAYDPPEERRAMALLPGVKAKVEAKLH